MFHVNGIYTNDVTAVTMNNEWLTGETWMITKGDLRGALSSVPQILLQL